MIEKYSSNKSRISTYALMDYLNTPLTGNLLEVPGVGEITLEILTKSGIKTTYDLIEKYRSFSNADDRVNEFHHWLGEIGITKGYSHSITYAIIEKNKTLNTAN